MRGSLAAWTLALALIGCSSPPTESRWGWMSVGEIPMLLEGQCVLGPLDAAGRRRAPQQLDYETGIYDDPSAYTRLASCAVYNTRVTIAMVKETRVVQFVVEGALTDLWQVADLVALPTLPRVARDAYLQISRAQPLTNAYTIVGGVSIRLWGHSDYGPRLVIRHREHVSGWTRFGADRFSYDCRTPLQHEPEKEADPLVLEELGIADDSDLWSASCTARNGTRRRARYLRARSRLVELTVEGRFPVVALAVAETELLLLPERAVGTHFDVQSVLYEGTEKDFITESDGITFRIHRGEESWRFTVRGPKLGPLAEPTR